jgi:glycosyltransferase involved in cell wall biosynthesis
MHILLVADGRSPITRRWLDGLLALHYQITLVSSHPCEPPEGIQALYVVPIAFSRFTAGGKGLHTGSAQPGLRRQLVKTFRSPFLAARYTLGPLSVRYYAPRFREIVAQVKPDLVHALRIPFEGMLASHTPAEIPLAISIWGNDLTLHAPKTHSMGRLTRQTLRRANGLHTDAQRDLRLAHEWGYPDGRPDLVVPSNGGMDLERVQRMRAALPAELEVRIPKDHTLVINPRGVRAYTRTDTFFQAIPLVLEQSPKTAFVCPSMAGEAQAERWAAAVHADERVVLLPVLSQGQLWDLFTRCPVSISVTNHDGTPNTLLEAMSCGSFPVAGNIESLREWIDPGVNGLLVDPGSPRELANTVLEALNNPEFRERANQANLDMIRERAEVSHIQPKIAAFYQKVLGLG